jgi:polar amino acid transport system substrate-binding protein
MRAKLGLLLAAICLLLTSHAEAQGVLRRAADRGKLIAAVVPDSLPQATRDASGKLIGFDIEVATEIARRLGLGIEFVTPTWQQILAGGWARRWDVAVASITPTRERATKIDFPAVYRYDLATLVVHKDNEAILVPEDASGKVIGVKQDTTFEDYLKGTLSIFMGPGNVRFRIKDPVIRTFPDKDRALQALAEGDGVKLDAVVMSFADTRQAVADRMPVRAIPGFLYTEPVAIAVDKGDQRFVRAIEDAVLKMSGDGTLSTLSKKWFGTDLSHPLLP